MLPTFRIKTFVLLSLTFCSLNIFSQTIDSIRPNRGKIGDLLNVFISGSNVNFTNGSSSIQTNFIKGSTNISATPLRVSQSGEVLEVFLDLGNPSYPSGMYDLSMITPAHGLLTFNNAFRIDSTALLSSTPGLGFLGQSSIDIKITGRLVDFNNVTNPYFFRNNDTIFATINQTLGADTLEINVDLSLAGIREGNYDFQISTNGGPLYLRNCLSVKTTTIQGHAFYDENTNGIKDPGEFPVGNVTASIQSIGKSAVSNLSGNFTIDNLSQGTYNVSYTLPPYMTPTTPTSQNITVNSQSVFQLNPVGIDVSSNTVGFLLTRSIVRCGINVRYSIKLKNNFNHSPINGVYYLVKDTNLTFSPGSTISADSIRGDTIYFSFSSLQTGAFISKSVYCALPPISVLPINTVIDAEAFAFETDLNGFPIPGRDTSDFVSGIVRCSYDPNDKQVSPIGLDSFRITPPDSRLEYTIRFQNIGNDTAYRVVLLDTISPNLDLNSFSFIESSHETNIQLDTISRELKFTFDDIMLVDSMTNEPESNGFATFSLNPIPGLPDSTQVYNTASIYFDFNPPIVTNTTLNTLARIITNTPDLENNTVKIEAYPNPTNGSIKMSIPSNESFPFELKVYDLKGAILIEETIYSANYELRLNALKDGVYIIRMSNNKKAYNSKVILQKQ
tara:strand:- start:770 stop:2788 length:2019 start_codon:yes stop_codon:yes gene_type:complete